MKILVEFRYFLGPHGQVTASARCKAPGCGKEEAGDLESVLTHLVGHLRSHGNDFSKKRAPWAKPRAAPTSSWSD